MLKHCTIEWAVGFGGQGVRGTCIAWDGVQGSGASLRKLSIPFTSHAQRATPIPFFFCLTCCHCVSVQERVPQLYVHFPVCRESSVTMSGRVHPPRQPRRPTTSLYWSRRAGKLPASASVSVIYPPSVLGSESGIIPLCASQRSYHPLGHRDR